MFTTVTAGSISPLQVLLAVFSSILGRIRAFVGRQVPSSSDTDILTLPEGPRACILVLDASGSMADRDWRPSRLAAAKEAAKAFCRRLAREEPKARVAIVGYSDNAELLVNLTPAKHLETLIKAIDQIRAFGGTNITAGIAIAVDLLKNGPGQVIALTDGHHNEGPGPANIAHDLKQLAVLECVGIGGSPSDVDETLLKEIASPYPDGTKRYRWIGDKEQLVRHFHNLAGGITRS